MGELQPIAMNRGSSELWLTVLYGSQTGTAQEVAEVQLSPLPPSK